jgi:hypothetical protein
MKELDQLIPKIIINDADTDKKGRNIITNNEYTHIGISQMEKDGVNFIILIFSKKLSEPEGKKEPPEKSCDIFSNSEKSIYEQIKQFRENPKSFLDKKNIYIIESRKIMKNF